MRDNREIGPPVVRLNDDFAKMFSKYIKELNAILFIFVRKETNDI